jgi:predicted Zn-dependent protease
VFGATDIRCIAVALWVVFAAGCAHDDVGRSSSVDWETPDTSDDALRELGHGADREIQQQADIIHDPIISNFVNQLGQTLVAEIEPQPFIYRFRVIKARSLNAFAIPGGYVYLHSETLMQMGSLDELVGVLCHEIAHVQARHFSRRQAKTSIPGMVARLLGIGAAIAAKEPGMVMVGEAINMSLQIGFTREFEAEADQYAAIWAARAGYDPAGITRFLYKIARTARRFPDSFPPYLNTHPFPEDRMAAIKTAAEGLRVIRTPDPALAKQFPEVQARLAWLMDTRRTHHFQGPIIENDPETQLAISEAGQLASAGNLDGALLVLGRVDSIKSNDPEVPFQIGELLYESGRYPEAATQYLRALALDPAPAMAFFKLGLAFRNADQRHRAVYAFEQAAMRTPPASKLWQRCDWEIFKLTFAPVDQAVFMDGSGSAGTPTALLPREAQFTTEITELVWQAQIGSRFTPFINHLDVRWLTPSGEVAQEKSAKRFGKYRVESLLKFGEARTAAAGRWTLELRLRGEVIDRRGVILRPSSEIRGQP